MLVLRPICHETIWGGKKIAQLCGMGDKKIGHLYSIFCRKGISNEILNGCWMGMTLNEIFPELKVQFHMKDYDFFPLTLALTEANDNLSIQVHPDDEAASLIERKSRGKRESWYFLDAPHSGCIINGCLCRTEEEMRRYLDEKKYLEMSDILPVSAGDYVFVEPGTLHSLTAGSLVYEIEEGADYTYRFYDYNRVDSSGKPRELHIEKASIALHMENKSCAVRYPSSGIIVEKTYITKKIENISHYANLSNNLECLTLISGFAQCDNVELTPGMTVILFPGEKVENADLTLAFSASYRGGAQ